MALQIQAQQLLSRVIRSNAANGVTAVLNPPGGSTNAPPRRINSVTRLYQQQNSGGFLQKLWDSGKKIAGFIVKTVGLVMSATAIFGWLIEGVRAIMAFDWNATDEALAANIKNQNIMIASIWGGITGQALGWLTGIAVGYAIGLALPVVGGGILAKSIALTLKAEAIEEMLGNLLSAITQTVQALAYQGTLQAYMGFRRFLKRADKKTLERFFGKNGADFIKNEWGEEGSPVLTFSNQIEEGFDSIPNDYVRAFTEEAFEEYWETFIEAGFIIAAEIDEAYAQNRAAQQVQQGQQRSVTVQPDEESDETLNFVNVPQNILIPSIQTTINQARLVENRDIGQIVGEPLREHVRAEPMTIQLRVYFYDSPRPPFAGTGREVTRATYSIPDVQRSKLDWEQIKFACGGANGYMWGRFRATANLSNGRQMAVYGATESEAEDRLKALLLLSNTDILTLSITEEKREGRRASYKALYKEPTRLYPAYLTLINQQKILNEDSGRATLTGAYRRKKYRMPLWTPVRPPNFNETIQELLRSPGINA